MTGSAVSRPYVPSALRFVWLIPSAHNPRLIGTARSVKRSRARHERGSQPCGLVIAGIGTVGASAACCVLGSEPCGLVIAGIGTVGASAACCVLGSEPCGLVIAGIGTVG